MSGHLTREEKDKWKDDVLKSRFNDFCSLRLWMIEENIKFEDNEYFYDTEEMIIEYDLRVIFKTGKKKYQYNLEKLKQRLSKTNPK